jgi:hypothetical protein
MQGSRTRKLCGSTGFASVGECYFH